MDGKHTYLGGDALRILVPPRVLSDLCTGVMDACYIAVLNGTVHDRVNTAMVIPVYEELCGKILYLRSSKV